MPSRRQPEDETDPIISHEHTGSQRRGVLVGQSLLVRCFATSRRNLKVRVMVVMTLWLCASVVFSRQAISAMNFLSTNTGDNTVIKGPYAVKIGRHGLEPEAASAPAARMPLEFRDEFAFWRQNSTWQPPLRELKPDLANNVSLGMEKICKRLQLAGPSSTSEKTTQCPAGDSPREQKAQVHPNTYVDIDEFLRGLHDRQVLAKQTRSEVWPLARGNVQERVCTKLMIVAHQDDELIFGGETLICSALYDETDCWHVVQTRGTSAKRVNQFLNVAAALNTEYTILPASMTEIGWHFGDNTKAALRAIFAERQWSVVLTHSLGGEYGYAHHKMLHRVVLETIPSELQRSLYVFDPRPDEPTAPSQLKTNLLALYSTTGGERSACANLFTWTEGHIPHCEWYRSEASANLLCAARFHPSLSVYCYCKNETSGPYGCLPGTMRVNLKFPAS